MKKSKLWAKFKIREELERWQNTEGGVGEDMIEYVLNIIKQIEEPEVLPVIPKFVAEWITKHRDTYDLYPALRMLENNTLVWSPIYEWYRMNTHKFVNVYLTGACEVEKEQKYHALLKGYELLNIDGIYWTYDKNNYDVIFSELRSPHGNFSTELSKNGWNKLGINDSNANFVKVEELEQE